MANFYKESQFAGGGEQQEKSRQSARRAWQEKLQSGRSMIEMLGVLAIIGVLSIASISGYTKAMDQYRWNKALDQWNSLIGLINRYRSELQINDRSDITSEVDLIPLLSGFSELPTEMIVPNRNYIQDAMRTRIAVYNHGTGYIGMLASNREENNKACRLMLTIGQYHHATINYLQIYNLSGGNSVFYGDDRCCKNCKNCLKDILISDIATACRNNPVCTDSDSCNYLLYW